MEQYFNYSVQASGKAFIGRKSDVNALSNLILAGENVVLYGEPHQGRASLVKQTLTTLKMSGQNFNVAEVDLLGCRTNKEVLLRYVSAVLKICAGSLEDYESLIYSYLDGCGLSADEDAFSDNGDFLAFTDEPAPEQYAKLLSLPFSLARDRGVKIIVYMTKFQNSDWDSQSHILFDAFEKVLSERTPQCSLILTGNRFNAMKDIFEVKRRFWKMVELLPLSEIPVMEITEFVFRGFQNKGKVVDRRLISEAVRMLRGNMWYVLSLFAITDYVSIGYVTQKSFDEAMSLLLALHRSRFMTQMADLTDFQMRMLKAIIDGETKLSSSSIVDKYSLNSSANVKRLKDALVKKEVVWFDDKDEPHIQDTFFEYWLRKEYFAK